MPAPTDTRPGGRTDPGRAAHGDVVLEARDLVKRVDGMAPIAEVSAGIEKILAG